MPSRSMPAVTSVGFLTLLPISLISRNPEPLSRQRDSSDSNAKRTPERARRRRSKHNGATDDGRRERSARNERPSAMGKALQGRKGQLEERRIRNALLFVETSSNPIPGQLIVRGGSG